MKTTEQRVCQSYGTENRGAGYGLNIPCQYGPKLYIAKLKELINAMIKKGIIL